MKKNLLVTLADKNYLKPAKQLFSSIYWNAGWNGDYMLFSHEIPEKDLKWFRNKGILIKKCKPLYYDKVGGWRPPTHTSKFYLFSPELKKWENIVYLDGDIIVRASLKKLTEIKGFGAVLDVWNERLSDQIIGTRLRKIRKLDKRVFNNLFNEISSLYQLKELAFNSGVMAFSTDIIKDKTLPELLNIFKKYKEISVGGDQLILNIFFYKNWIEIPWAYNIWPVFMRRLFSIKNEDVDGIILHFVGMSHNDKPWITKDYFYKEWMDNLQKAELVNLEKYLPPSKEWTDSEIAKFSNYLKPKRVYFKKKYFKIKDNIEYDIEFILKPTFSINRIIGLIGIFLKEHWPKLYFKLKKVKNGK